MGDVDGLPYPLHRPTAYHCQTMGHGLLPDDASFCHSNER
jgi:hypothetical protein